MTKSEASKKLEEFARGMPDAYEDFIAFMGRGPQIHGVDDEMLRLIEDNPKCSHDDILMRYYSLTLLQQ